MSTNCIRCVVNKRTSFDLLCDDCRSLKAEEVATDAPAMAPEKETTGEASEWENNAIATKLLREKNALETQLTATQAVMKQMAEALEKADAKLVWHGAHFECTPRKEISSAFAAYKALTPKETKL